MQIYGSIKFYTTLKGTIDISEKLYKQRKKLLRKRSRSLYEAHERGFH